MIKRIKSFRHAGRGIWVFIKRTPNSWIHLTILALVILLGIYLRLTQIEWMILILAAGFVLSAEAFNTAIELHMDLTSPDYHPHARDTKDVAAGAVLIASITAFIVGLFIFIPHLIPLLS